MLIVSPYRDFYDHILAFGVDKTIVYQRKESEISIEVDGDFPSLNGSGFLTRLYGYDYAFRVIGFCGKLYPFITVVQQDRRNNDESTNKKCFYLYSVEDVKKFLLKFNIKEKKEDRGYFRHTHYGLRNPDELVNFFKEDAFRSLLTIFSKHNVPVFVLFDIKGYMDRTAKVNLNPRLKSYDFVKAKDPISAFQELMNYISGVLGVPNRPMVKLSDKELAKKRGHDDPYSFRKTPKRGKRNG